MPFIFGNTEIEKVICIDRKTGIETELDLLICNGQIIWQTQPDAEMTTIVLDTTPITSTDETSFTGTLTITKKDTNSTTIKLNDTIISVLTTSGEQVIDLGNILYNAPCSITIEGEGKLAIGNNIFSTSIMVDQLLLGKNIEELLPRCFDNLSVESFNIPASVITIGIPIADSGIGMTKNIDVSISNKFYSSDNGVLFNKAKTTLIAYPFKNERESYSIPSQVKVIEDSAFCYANLISIALPSELTTIRQNAFSKCTYLTSLTIPRSVTSIGDFAFSNSSGAMALTEMRFEQPSGMAVTLPAPGSSTGMLYVKTARNMTIYTDNETIKNYDYATDNITATILHLDGSAW